MSTEVAMSWSASLVILVVAVPLLVCVARVVAALRRGDLPSQGRAPHLVALGLLGAGALVWSALSRDSEADVPWGWAVAVLLAVAAAVAVPRPAVVGRWLKVTAVLAPVAAAAAMGCVYVFGSGVSSGDGGTESVGTMLGVAVTGAAVFYALPALAVSVLLVAAQAPPRDPPPGWYPDPRRPETKRYWDGSAWAAQERSSDPGKRDDGAALDPGSRRS